MEQIGDIKSHNFCYIATVSRMGNNCCETKHPLINFDDIFSDATTIIFILSGFAWLILVSVGHIFRSNMVCASHKFSERENQKRFHFNTA